MIRHLGAAVAITGCALSHAPALGAIITVGTFTSERSCSVYALTSGRSASVETAYVAVAVSSFKTELVRSCTQNFPAMRSTVAAAIASSGKFTGGQRLVLSGRLTDAGVHSSSVATGGVSMASDSAVVSIEYQLRDATGKAVYGGLITKSLPVSTTVSTDAAESSDSQSGRSLFSQLQREAALAVARSASFKVEPLRVTGNDGRHIRLNYGEPFVGLGATVNAESRGGMGSVRLDVTSATSDSALAESEAGASLADIAPGSRATYIEGDANGRRYERVDLP